MSVINDLIAKIEDNELRERLNQEIKRLNRTKRFGLVFEEHQPECTPLYDLPIKIGSNVALKNGSINDIYKVASIDENTVICYQKDKTVSFSKDDLVCVAQFGEPIYPYLKPIDSICNAPDSSLWHTLIEADNYHALQLLEYLYAGKVDCIYIDPPYNTGAKDWKYNNNYVDGNDAYRHSKWLSFMKKRLVLAKKLLNLQDSVLIVTIDEKEYLHLGCLLEETFPEANMQMVSSIIAQKGVARSGSFYRTNEYIFFVQFGKSQIYPLLLPEQWRLGNKNSNAAQGIVWAQLRRGATNYLRTDRPKLFYPIIFNESGTKIIDIGETMPLGQHPSNALEHKDNTLWLWPIKSNGEECNWQLSQTELRNRLEKGYVKLGKLQENTIWVSYLKSGSISKIENQDVKVIGYENTSGTVIVDAANYERAFIPGSQWNIELHDATYHGSQLLNRIFLSKRFSFPKSLYAVKDALKFVVANKPNALILDFFGGSGTTLHAINLLNAEDNGNRRCIIVTNNELSDEESQKMRKNGYKPGEEEWEKLGIARYVTWPRTTCSILGIDVKGSALEGEYITSQKTNVTSPRRIRQIALDGMLLSYDVRKNILSLLTDEKGKARLPQKFLTKESNYILEEGQSTSIIFNLAYVDEWLELLAENKQITDVYIVTEKNSVFKKLKAEVTDILGPIVTEEPVKLPMKDGFKANVEYFKLGFVDKTLVSLGRKFAEMLPMLWMKSGAYGPRPTVDNENLPEMLVLPQNQFAVLLDETYFAEFEEAVKQHPEIKYLYFVTDSRNAYVEMISKFDELETCQLYKDYLDNFRINIRR